MFREDSDLGDVAGAASLRASSPMMTNIQPFLDYNLGVSLSDPSDPSGVGIYYSGDAPILVFDGRDQKPIQILKNTLMTCSVKNKIVIQKLSMM